MNPNPHRREMWLPAARVPPPCEGEPPGAAGTRRIRTRHLSTAAPRRRHTAGAQEDTWRGWPGRSPSSRAGGSGIGEATALALAREGARVAVVGRRAEPLEALVDTLDSEGRTAFALPADVTDPDAAEGLVAEVRERWGRVDVLVNSAGINVPRRDLASLSVADWDAVLRVNLTGTFLVTHAVLPIMREQRSGTIVNVSSIAGYRAMALTGPAYNAAKAGVNAFTESINLADRRHGIRACAVCPGRWRRPSSSCGRSHPRPRRGRRCSSPRISPRP